MKKHPIKQIISASFLIAGTTVGAGMLGIPLLTAQAGFWPAIGITFLAWGIMLWTGLLFLEATLWMPIGSNLLSMSDRFFGKKGRVFSGMMFLFLYYCLLVAYFAAGAPMLVYGINKVLGLHLSGVSAYAVFGLLFALIVGLGAKWIDRTNLILTTGMVFAYLLLIGLGSPEVEGDRLELANWPASFFSMPVLFAAFGYHNIIPSLCTYFKKDQKILKTSIIIGTVISLIIYLIWQWLILGIIPLESIKVTLQEGRPVTSALQDITGNVWIFRFGQTFAFFALLTSLLGVSFSMVDFLADGWKVKRTGIQRMFLSLITFFPPFVLVSLYPAIFDKALGIAGGIGEAILNGLIPIGLVWVGLYYKGLQPSQESRGYTRCSLSLIAIIILIVMGVEVFSLLTH